MLDTHREIASEAAAGVRKGSFVLLAAMLVVLAACGKKDTILRPVLLLPGSSAGKKGRVVVRDRHAGPWGHILVDDIAFLR